MANILDAFLGARKDFFLRDFRNASHLRPDVNPPRQRFQGYVNFILNRDLYDFLYEADAGKREFRTRISSLVRTADLPSASFQTETKNSYNRKKIVNTGVQYNPVNMTVFDTVGNEWLLTLMKYFSYHYMDPRNKQQPNNRDIEGSVVKQGGMYTKGSKFGLQGGTSNGNFTWDSNLAGYNPNLTAHFFERIDYVLYHGNRGVQYSIINPVLTEFKPGQLDYSSSEVMEFALTFEYERFTVFNKTNFDLADEDVDRFEDTSMIEGPAFGQTDLPLSMDARDLTILGNSALNPEPRGRTSNPESTVKNEESQEEADNTEQVDEEGNAQQNQEVPTVPPGDQPEADEVEESVGSETDETTGDTTTNTTSLPSTYGSSATFAPESGAEEGNWFTDILSDVADAGLAAAISGRSIKDAVLGTAVQGVTTVAGKAIRDSINGTAPNQGLTEEQINNGGG
jgi:hypothetical protein